MKIDRRKAALLATIVVTAVLLGFGAKAAFSRKDTKPVTAAVSIGDVEQTVLATGVLEPVRLISVGAQVTGQVRRLHVQLGQTVAKGQLIAEIDSAPQANALETALAELANVKAQRAHLEASLRQAELAFKRQAEMLTANATSRADYEAADASLRSARSQLAANTAQIDKAAVAVESARLNLGYTRIVAPMAGTIVTIVTEEGQTVSAVQAAPIIVKLAQLDTMTVKAEISEADVIKVQPGQSAYFTILGDPKRRYSGVLRTVEPAPESIETQDGATNVSSSSTAVYYNGLFEVPNTDGRLKTSMTAQVNIVLGRAAKVLTIPSAALGASSSDGAHTVQVLNARGEVEPRAVRIGLNNGSRAEVRSGLKAGEKVVLAQAAPAAGGQGGPPGGMRPPGGLGL